MNTIGYTTQLFRRLITFIRRHYPKWASESDESIAALLHWHLSKGLVSFSETQDGELRGLCIIRIIQKLEDFLNPLAFHPAGGYIWIELLISLDPVAQADVHDQLLAKWGPRPIVLWDRGERTQQGPPRMFTWNQFGRLKRRMTYGLL
jgi:hypothetical protein